MKMLSNFYSFLSRELWNLAKGLTELPNQIISPRDEYFLITERISQLSPASQFRPDYFHRLILPIFIPLLFLIFLLFFSKNPLFDLAYSPSSQWMYLNLSDIIRLGAVVLIIVLFDFSQG